MQNPLANFIGVFSLVRDDRGFQVNPLCRHDITRSDRQIGNCNLALDMNRSSFLYLIFGVMEKHDLPLLFFTKESQVV